MCEDSVQCNELRLLSVALSDCFLQQAVNAYSAVRTEYLYRIRCNYRLPLLHSLGNKMGYSQESDDTRWAYECELRSACVCRNVSCPLLSTGICGVGTHWLHLQGENVQLWVLHRARQVKVGSARALEAAQRNTREGLGHVVKMSTGGGTNVRATCC